MTTFFKLRDIIEEHAGVPFHLITTEARFDDDLGLDSLDVIEVVMIAEDAFGIDIPDEALEKIKTVQDAVGAVDHAISDRGAA